MSAKDKASIKSFFQTNDKPTQAQFVDFIDSYVDAAGPIGAVEAAVSAGNNGVVVAGAGMAFIDSYTNVRASQGITVYTTALAQAALVGLFATTADVAGIVTGLYATTAQAQSGTDNTTVMNPVLVKAAIATQGTSEMVLLGTQTASTSATLDFASLITSSYDYYIFVLKDILGATNSAELCFRTSTNNGVSYDSGAANYVGQSWFASLSGAATGETNNAHSLTFGRITAGGWLSNDSDSGYCGKVELVSPLSTARVKTLHSEGSIFKTGSTPYSVRTAICRNSTSVINAVRFMFDSGNITSGTIYMYGVKNT